MPSSHLVRVVDKEWLNAMEKSNADLFLCAYERLIPSSVNGVKTEELKNNSIYPITLPPLRLRTPRGGELEIDSAFQKQLRVAKLCHLLGLPEVLTEWRFPKTQVPSRPDFSRSTAPHYRHTGRPGQVQPSKDLPATMTPSKYHVKSLQNLEDLQELRSDNIPSYVAAYLESSPRDPLAAEECSRRAASMVNEAAPKKVYLPIVNQASVHDKLLQPVEVRHPPHEYPQWCFGCRLEHGIQTRETHESYDVYMCQNRHCRFASWQGLPVLFGPFRDKPVRVGGGFAYPDSSNVESGHTASQGKGEGRKDGNFYRKHSGAPKPGELPKMYHPSFIPFKPKTQPKENLRQKRLPMISETDGIPLDEEELKAFLGEKTTESMQVELQFLTPARGATSPVGDSLSSADQLLPENLARRGDNSSDIGEVGVLKKSMNIITDKALFLQMENQFQQLPSAVISTSTPAAMANNPPEGMEISGVSSDKDSQQKVSSVFEENYNNPLTSSDPSVCASQTTSGDGEDDIGAPHISCTIQQKVDISEDAKRSVKEVLPSELDVEPEDVGVAHNGSVNNLSESNDLAKVTTSSNHSDNVDNLTTVLQQTVVVTPYKETSTASPSLSSTECINSPPTSPSLGSCHSYTPSPCSSPYPPSATAHRLTDVPPLKRKIFYSTCSGGYKHVTLKRAWSQSTDTNNLNATTSGDASVELSSAQLADDPISKKKESSGSEKSEEVLPDASQPEQTSPEITRAEDSECNTPESHTSEVQVINSPLLGEKPEFRWVLKPLQVLEYVGEFTNPEVLPQVVEQRAQEVVHLDELWCEMESNVVSSEVIPSKEFVPVWSITRDILHDVLEDVLQKIAKKKAPPKKVKGERVRKPAKKVKEVKQKTPSPPPREPTPPPKTPTPSPPPVLPSRKPTPPKEKPPTPPRQPTLPKPSTPPPKKVLELPPLPQTSNFVAQPKTNKPTKAKPQASKFGASLVSRAEAPHNRRNCKRDETPSTLSPSPLAQSPDYEFDIVPRSPSSTSVISVTPEASKPQARVLDVKVDEVDGEGDNSQDQPEKPVEEGNDWTFRRLNVPILTNPPAVETLPEIVEKAPTPVPEPAPPKTPAALRRPRKLPVNITKVVRTAFRKKSGPTTTKKELKSIVDPLDYLAKYCLIHPERLPVYERIFKEVVAKQQPRFNDVYCVLDKSSEQRPLPVAQVDEPGYPHKNLLSEERKRLRDMAMLNSTDDHVAVNAGEYQVNKLTFTLEQLYAKYDKLLDEYEELDRTKEQRMATLAKQMYPRVLLPGYDMYNKVEKKAKKSKKSKKSEKLELPDIHQAKDLTLSDGQVVERLNAKQKAQLESDEEVRKLNLQLNRLESKVQSAEKRMDELEAERMEMQVWAEELYLKETVQSYHKPEFRRKQSALFNKFHSDLDEQMNIDEVEEALRTVNGHLITDKELQFVYHILKVPGRKVLNMKTFSCVAALSEKVQQLHPVIRKLINKFDFEALDVKMEKCKELYDLLYEGPADKPNGTIPIRALCVELQAGGLSAEHLNFVTDKLNRTQKGYVEYMDFLTYVPLFVEMHDRICSNPLATERVS